MRSTAAEKRARPDIGIVDAAGREIEADAAEAGLLHGVEIAFAGLVVDHGDAARIGAARLHAEQGRRNCRCRRRSASRSPRARYAAPCAAPTFPRARPAPACRRGRRRTEIFRDRRGYGCGNRRRRPERRNSPASTAAPLRRDAVVAAHGSLRPRWKKAGDCVSSAWSSPSRFLFSTRQARLLAN